MCPRIEADSLGNYELPDQVYYGIHTARSRELFQGLSHLTHLDLIDALLLVKKAAALANEEAKRLDPTLSAAIVKACDYLHDLCKADYDLEKKTSLYEHYFPLDALQGGAGTSTNMNVNEVIANVALENLGHNKGDYHILHPIDHVNLSQSTNDVYPTALKIAAIGKIRTLATALSRLQESLQLKEQDFATVLKLGRTQLMDALPMTLGQGFGSYARAISRDRWRVYKVEERLREVNIGGTAIGTGINAPLSYTFRVIEHLKQLSGFGIARSDLPMDTTQNADVYVEVFGFLKAAATNLIKISNDIRLLASGPYGGFGELNLQPLQAGSTIMPGKVNPVMPEMMVQVALKIIANDNLITQAAYLGQLELNAFMPVIADTLLSSLDSLTTGVDRFRQHCIDTLTAQESNCRKHLESSNALAATLIETFGYDTCANYIKEAHARNLPLRDYLITQHILSESEAQNLFAIHRITQPSRNEHK